MLNKTRSAEQIAVERVGNRRVTPRPVGERLSVNSDFGNAHGRMNQNDTLVKNRTGKPARHVAI